MLPSKLGIRISKNGREIRAPISRCPIQVKRTVLHHNIILAMKRNYPLVAYGKEVASNSIQERRPQQYIQQRITITISKMNTTYTND